MYFEYDAVKSRSNKEKHGIDFEEAKQLWDDVNILEIPTKNTDEPRFVVIGRIGRKIWTAVITYREKYIRIISVRRARKEEEELYESEAI